MRKQVGLIIIFAILVGLLASYLVLNLTSTPNSSEAASTKLSSALSTEVNLLTSDGISLNAHYYPPMNSESETVTLLLLHGAYEDSNSWNDFRKIAQDEGYAVFTVDFRGHGHSDGEKTFVEAMDNDVDAALDWLENSLGVSEQQIALMGESLGANLALRAGARHPEIPAVILLSPGMLLWKISISEAIVSYGSRPLLLVASEEDGYPAATVRQLDEQARGFHELLLFPGAEHGTKMLEANPNLSLQMLTWLQESVP